MIIKLFDKTEIDVSDEQSEIIKKELMKGLSGFIKIGDLLINKTAIALIKPDKAQCNTALKGLPQYEAIGTARASRATAISVRRLLEKRGILKRKDQENEV